MKNEKMSVHFSSKSDDWETPQKLFDELNAEFDFTLDVCASPENAKCRQYLSEGGLEKKWGKRNFMNPPYGRSIGLWVKKASENPLTVCLLPARTDTRWFHDHIYNNPAAQVRFIKGRLCFGQATENAPFPNMIVVFWGKKKAI